MSDTPQTPTGTRQPTTSVPQGLPADTKSVPGVAAASPDKDTFKVNNPSGANVDPLREVLYRLERLQPILASYSTELGTTVKQLSQEGADSEALGHQKYRQALAYAHQDAERTAVGRLEVSPAARAEVTKLATSAPGLENERMLVIMRSTPDMANQNGVDMIRHVGREIGKEADQATPKVVSMIDALENRLRLLQQPAEAMSANAGITSPTQPAGAGKPPNDGNPLGANRAPNDGQDGPTTPPNNGPGSGSRPVTGTTPSQIAISRSPFDVIFSALRPRESAEGAPWEAAHTPMKERVAAFELKVQERTDGETLVRTEKSGRAALDAMQAFSTGEGATVMNRIREAAKSDPGGMAGVLAEMKEGGRFADLRGQFNNALLDERGVTAAYDRAASALAKYGDKRTQLDEVIARRPDAANLAAKFEKMDEAIGEAASHTPSRKDGKSMVDDLAKAASDLFNRAVDGVRSMFSRTPASGAGAQSSPSPSPS